MSDLMFAIRDAREQMGTLSSLRCWVNAMAGNLRSTKLKHWIPTYDTSNIDNVPYRVLFRT